MLGLPSAGIEQVSWTMEHKKHPFCERSYAVTIEERLTQLERKNRRLTLALVSVGMAAIVAVAMGREPRGVPQEVTAHKFTLVDDNGKTRAALKVDEDGTCLSLYDQNGKTRAMLVVDKDGPGLTYATRTARGGLVERVEGRPQPPATTRTVGRGSARGGQEWRQPRPVHQEPQVTDHHVVCSRDVAPGHDRFASRPQPGPRHVRLRL